MPHVLGIIGSPRREGNTDILVTRVLDGATAAGATTETIYLGDLRIRECDGCHACWKSGRCTKADDMLGVYPKIIASDAIVFGTPVYWYGPTGLMKLLIDRLVYFNSPTTRSGIAGKSAALAVPFEENDTATAALVEAVFEKSLDYLQVNLIGKLIVPGVTEKGDVLGKPECLDEAFALGRKLAEPIMEDHA
jgi:multimeric flavodoxin WrbA